MKHEHFYYIIIECVLSFLCLFCGCVSPVQGRASILILCLLLVLYMADPVFIVIASETSRTSRHNLVTPHP